MAKSSIAETPKSANKSWVELCDEDDSYFNSDDEKISYIGVNKTPEKQKIQTKECKIEIKQELEESEGDENMPTEVISEISTKELKIEKEDDKYMPTKVISEISSKEIKIEKEDSPLTFSYASILKNSCSKSNISTPQTANKPTKEKITNSDELNPVKSVKREIQREFLHEDLSISSHLDIFHMESPIKLEPLDEAMESPSKLEKLSKKRGCSSKLVLDEDAVMPDDLLMPSPTKVTRFSSRRKREPGESPLNCKRSRQSYGGPRTPRCVVPVRHPPVEFETDEQVLLRRQKQIDYGKNTIGYERYCQMVSKEKRSRKHPQTPPKYEKYSRRAWDGLIRKWRQQLHFWDPPSEGGGNINDLDISSMSDISSSDTVSQPATPRGQKLPRRSSRTSVRSSTSESSGITDESGCSPIKMN